MILTNLLTASLALGLGHITYASKLAITRCYCVSDTEVGFVSIYNLTTSSPSSLAKYTNSSSSV